MAQMAPPRPLPPSSSAPHAHPSHSRPVARSHSPCSLAEASWLQPLGSYHSLRHGAGVQSTFRRTRYCQPRLNGISLQGGISLASSFLRDDTGIGRKTAGFARRCTNNGRHAAAGREGHNSGPTRRTSIQSRCAMFHPDNQDGCRAPHAQEVSSSIPVVVTIPIDETPPLSPSPQSPAASKLHPLAQLVSSSVRQSVWAAAFGVLLLAGARAAVAQTGDHVSMNSGSKNAVIVTAASTVNGAASNGDASTNILVRNAAGGAGRKVVGSEGEKAEGAARRGEEGEKGQVREGQGGGEERKEEEEEREGVEEEAEMGRAYSRWVEKPASLSVPLRVVALRGTVASMWRKDFLQSQSPLAKLTVDARPSHAAIASDLLAPLPAATTPAAPSSSPCASGAPPLAPSAETSKGQARGKKGGAQPSLRSAAAADVVTVGDRWLKELISRRALLPLDGVERSDWFKALGPTWLRLLDRTPSGHLTLPGPPTTTTTTTTTSGSSGREGGEGAVRGKVYAVPYRMGYLAVAWRADKLQQKGIKPIQMWSDLWQPALRGQVAVIDSPRELLAVTMKSLGAPFNAHSPLDSHVPGGLPALKARWQALLHQIRVCDSSNYLKAFQASDVLVVVGWSSDLLPFARRNNNITVAAPADGTLLFADLWAVPATARYNIPKAAWRNRGPSPLIGQWMKFCLQPARAVPLEREIFSAFSPTVLPDCLPLAPMLPADDSSINAASTSGSSTKGSTSRATNTSNSNTSSSSSTTTTTATASSSSSSSSARGLPAAGILAASEFVEPLDGATQAELNQVLLGDTKGGVAAQGQTMQGRVKQAIEAVGSALDKLRKRG